MTEGGPIPEGNECIYWIYMLFGDCAYTKLDAVSILLGYLSVVCWLGAQLPQVIKNFKDKCTEAISLPFLAIWLVGDVTNLVGCILTQQLAFQRWLGEYFVSVDVILVLQWIYYEKIRSKPQPPNTYTNFKPKRTDGTDDEPTQPLLMKIPSDSSSGYFATSASASPSKYFELSSQPKITLLGLFLFGTQRATTLLTTQPGSRTITNVSITSDDYALWIGSVVAWTCTACYLASRIPQIIKNVKRKSVEGLAPSLFACAAGGNMFYAASIFTRADSDLLKALPYLLGSAGTLIFDAIIILQFFWWYRPKDKQLHPSRIDTMA